MKTTLKSDFKTPQECLNLIDQLYDQFYKQYKRNPTSELFYAQSGTKDKPIIELLVYYENQEEFEYFKALI